mmetsp:Transcript_53430/g.173843  ORF Transcript_53430/g.173843 Transcript_53430/m.173843 type:complete len:332 (-) Transcript_53430:2553-3548(-)
MAPATASTRGRFNASAHSTSGSAQRAAAMALGLPSVTVPVLSSTMNVFLPREAPRSSTDASLTRQWCRLLATPTATEMAVGVARPIAQGQASIMTARPNCSARQILSAGSCGASSMSPAKRRNSHTAAVAKLSKRTQGTKRDARSSARRWTLGLLPCARDTSSASLPRVVAGPTAVTDMMISPLASVEPAKQHAADDPGGAPASFSTGADSPVTRDSSAAPPPSTTTPSAGKREPTETRQRSPSSNSSRGISWKLPPFSGSRTMAVVGWAAKSSFSAAAVRCRARNSSFLPPRTTSNNTGAIARKCAALPRSSVSTGLSALVKHKTVSPSP